MWEWQEVQLEPIDERAVAMTVVACMAVSEQLWLGYGVSTVWVIIQAA